VGNCCHDPKTSDGVYDEIDRAGVIDLERTLLSTSWGLGQIMGSNFRLAGCATVEDMVEQAVQSELNQLRQMVSFLKTSGILSRLADQGLG
jgi:hypothetical protein